MRVHRVPETLRVAENALLHPTPSFGCLQSAYNLGTRSQCKRQRARRTAATILIFLRKLERARGFETPDPNLGKVGVVCFLLLPRCLPTLILIDI